MLKRFHKPPTGDKVHEAILDAKTTRELVTKIRAALDPTNKKGIGTLDQLMQILF